MLVTIGEIKRMISEELTPHNMDRLKSLMQSVISVCSNYVENLKFKNRNDKVALNDVIRASRELEVMVKWLKGRNDPNATQANEVLYWMKKFDKMSDPFKRLFTSKTKQAEKLEPVLERIKSIIEKNWSVKRYHEKYQNFDDDLAQQRYDGPVQQAAE